MKGQWVQWRTAFIIIIAALCAVFLLVRRPAAMPDDFLATPAPTPVPTLTPSAQPGAEAAAPPEVTPASTPIPGAMTVLIEGEPVVTLSKEEEAEQLLNAQLQQYDAFLPEGEMPLYTEFAKEVTVREAHLGEEPVTLEQARAKLSGDAMLCPVRAVTQQVESETLAFETILEEDARFGLGTRIVLQAGRTGYNRMITIRTYINGFIQGEPAQQEQVLPPIDERIALGVHRPSASQPGRQEGERGKAAEEGFTLQLPFDGDIVSNFGMRGNEMHNGLDIACEVGDTIIAPASGKVVFFGERGSYGLMMDIDHGNGFVSRLSCLQASTLQVGAEVGQGQALAPLALPQDDEVTPHLHWELLIDGIPYNPRYYLDE